MYVYVDKQPHRCRSARGCGIDETRRDLDSEWEAIIFPSFAAGIDRITIYESARRWRVADLRIDQRIN